MERLDSCTALTHILPMADDIHGGMRPAEVPAYTPTEAARIIRRPVSTVRSWTRGSRYTTSAGNRFWPPIVPAHPPYLSFQNLVELYVLSSLRRFHAVPLKNVRSAIAYLRETAQTDHPLADCDLLTDRSDLFVEKTGEYLNISRAGQLEMKAQLLQCMRQVDRGVDGLPDRLRLPDPKNESIVAAEVDPEIRFGQPRIPGTGIPTAIIYQRWCVGEAAARLAAVYERSVPEVTSAISYEESSRAA